MQKISVDGYSLDNICMHCIMALSATAAEIIARRYCEYVWEYVWI
ncbi:hypothetical protein ROS217_19047 [Roseovarius sp. 217]|nr:hypothetical protein ROS217_19047 [Roseovarius sp. 217]